VHALSLAELEQVRLVLRGGSVVDWYRLRFDGPDDVRAFLRISEGDADDPRDIARLERRRRRRVVVVTASSPACSSR
jgi:uncharacterized protein (TIGR04552 family)